MGVSNAMCLLSQDMAPMTVDTTLQVLILSADAFAC